MKIAVELESSLTAAEAIDGLSELIGDQIPLDRSFYDVLEGIEIGGNLLLELNLGAIIPVSDVSASSYTNIQLFTFVERFEASATISAKDISEGFAINLPGSTETIDFALERGSFMTAASVKLKNRLDIVDLFVGKEADPNILDFSGSLNVSFPLQVGSGTSDLIEITLLLEDEGKYIEQLPISQFYSQC